MGILTDGKYWLLRWPDAGAVKTAPPYGFTLDGKDGGGVRLHDWLRDRALVSRRNIPLHDRESVEKHFGVGNPHYEKDIARLRALYDRHKQSETVQVKRRLWDNLLRAALGEVAGTRRGLDDLFVRHTYLTAVIGLAVQANFRIEVAVQAEHDAEGLLKGEELRDKTGLHGIVESDFFAWPTAVAGGLPLVRTLARRIARFAWAQAPADIGAVLYETVIPPDERRVSVAITDTSEQGESAYAGYARQGATIVLRCLFFVEETENQAIVQAGQTITVNPRRGSQDKRPWRDLDLTIIEGQTIETQHPYDVHLGETVVPYVTLDPLKALLPLRHKDTDLPTDDGGVGGIRLGGLEQRMRERWQTISGLWEQHKARANKLNLLGQIDYLHKLSSQLEWQRNPDERPVRVMYSSSGVLTAALLQEC